MCEAKPRTRTNSAKNMRKIKFVKNHIYHIYNRGVEKRDIFESDNDKWRFLQGLFLFNNTRASINLLWQVERAKGRATFKTIKDFFKDKKEERTPLVRIMADCLMPNHFHLLIEEIQNGGISKFMHKLGLGYARYFNNKYERVGSLFQDKFKNILVDDEKYLLYLLVYINVLNPADLIEPGWREEGIKDIEAVLKFAVDYLWSTHQEYIGKRRSLIIEKGILKELLPTPKAYLDLVKAVLSGKGYQEIFHLALE